MQCPTTYQPLSVHPESQIFFFPGKQESAMQDQEPMAVYTLVFISAQNTWVVRSWESAVSIALCGVVDQQLVTNSTA